MKKLLKLLLPKTPFELAFPYRIKISDYREFVRYVNMYNGRKRLFYSLYNIDRENGRVNPTLDKIWFDLDNDKSFDNAKKLHKWAVKNNYKHLIVFSGGGFHFYLFTNKTFTKNSKAALTAIHKYIAKEVGLKIGDPKIADIDNHIVGDISRVVTIPNTYNTKRNRFAIPIKFDWLNIDKEFIIEKAKQQNFDYDVYEGDLFDLSEWNEIGEKQNNVNMTKVNIIINSPPDINHLPPCIQMILLNKKKRDRDEYMGDWRGRWIYTTYMKDAGYTPQQIDELAKKYFSKQKRVDRLKDNYQHYKKVRVIDLVWRRDDIFPSCKKMWEEGYCPGKCNFYQD